VRQYITLEILFVSFIFFNPKDKVYIGVVGCVFMLADFCKATCSSLLAILATCCGNSVSWKKADPVIKVAVSNLHV